MQPLVLSPNLDYLWLDIKIKEDYDTNLMDVEAMQTISKPSELTSDGDWTLSLLFKMNSSSDGAVTFENTDCFDHNEYCEDESEMRVKAELFVQVPTCTDCPGTTLHRSVNTAVPGDIVVFTILTSYCKKILLEFSPHCL